MTRHTVSSKHTPFIASILFALAILGATFFVIALKNTAKYVDGTITSAESHYPASCFDCSYPLILTLKADDGSTVTVKGLSIGGVPLPDKSNTTAGYPIGSHIRAYGTYNKLKKEITLNNYWDSIKFQ